MSVLKSSFQVLLLTGNSWLELITHLSTLSTWIFLVVHAVWHLGCYQKQQMVNLLLISEEMRHSMPNLARTSLRGLESVRSSRSLESDLQVPSSRLSRIQQPSASQCNSSTRCSSGYLLFSFFLIPFLFKTSWQTRRPLRGPVPWYVLKILSCYLSFRF